MNDAEGGLVAVLCAFAAPWLGYQAVTGYLASPAPWTSVGYAVLAFALLFGLWWLFGKPSPTGIQLAEKTVGKLHEEEAGRNRTATLAWVLFAAAAVLVFAALVSGAAG